MGTEYVGVLYGQFMKSDEEIRLIEFSAQFGDPEAINVLSILSSSMDDLCYSLIDWNLMRPRFDSVATVCIYLVPDGYPGSNVAKDMPIDIHSVLGSGTHYASVYEKDTGSSQHLAELWHLLVMVLPSATPLLGSTGIFHLSEGIYDTGPTSLNRPDTQPGRERAKMGRESSGCSQAFPSLSIRTSFWPSSAAWSR